MATNDFVSSLLDFPPQKPIPAKDYDKAAHEFVKYLSKQSDSIWTRPIKQQNIVDLLNPATNTLPYLFALASQSAHVGKDRSRNEELLNRAVVFFASFDPIQVRYAGEQFHGLLMWTFDTYPKLGITDCTPLTTAMLRLDPTAGTFTSSHLRLVRLCLQASAPSQALPILDKNIAAFPQTPPKSLPDELLCEEYELSNVFMTAKSGFSFMPLKAEWVLEYYLLGAYVYLGLRNFSRARLFYEYILLTPSVNGACSALQVEAYKKWLLLGLLAQGKGFPLPRTHNQQVLKNLKAVSKPYEHLVDVFEKRQWRKFAAEMDAGGQIWNEDGNTRLVREAYDALMRYRVLDLQKTYAALPVSRAAELLHLSLDDTHKLLSDMLQQGYLDAHITLQTSTTEAVLRFSLDANSTSKSSDESLEAQTSRIQAIVSTLRDADRRLQLSKEYVEVQKRNKRGGAGLDGDLADHMDLTYDAPIAGLHDDDDGDEDLGREDEDIMER